MVRTLAVANQKGGVGKTTTVVSVASNVALAGFRTLLIDLDPQGNATTGVGVNPREVSTSSYNVLVQQLPLSGARIQNVVPNNGSCSGYLRSSWCGSRASSDV